MSSLIVIDIVAFHLPSLWLFLFLQFPKQGAWDIGDAAFNMMLVSLWAIIHSLMPRRFAHALFAKWVGEDLVKVVFTVIAGITQCLMLYYWRPLEGTLWHAEGLLPIMC